MIATPSQLGNCKIADKLAPLLAEEGIDVPDVQTLQRALNHAMERHNMSLFTPVGHARELAATTLRLAAEAITDGNTPLAATVLDQAQPESPDGSAPTVAACTGVALGLLDQWLAGPDTDAPAGLAATTRLPVGLGTLAPRDRQYPNTLSTRDIMYVVHSIGLLGCHSTS